MTDFTLKMTVADRGAKNKGAETKDFKFNGKKLTGATIELGMNLGESGVTNLSAYPVMGHFNPDTAVSKENKAVGKIAHEFGHLDDFISMGDKFYEQEQVMKPFYDRQNSLISSGMSLTKVFEDAELKKLQSNVVKSTGMTPLEIGVVRDHRADFFAIPVIRQISTDTQTLQAARRLEKNVPNYK